MPRTDITAIVPVSINGTISADAADFTLTAVDVANKNSVTLTGRELIIVQNSHATLAKTVTITSFADAALSKRSGDITAYSLAAGEFAVFGPFPLKGWVQTDNKLYLEGESADIKVAIIRIPSTI